MATDVPLYGEIQGRAWATPQPDPERATFQHDVESHGHSWRYTNTDAGFEVCMRMTGPPNDDEARAFVRACQQLLRRFQP